MTWYTSVQLETRDIERPIAKTARDIAEKQLESFFKQGPGGWSLSSLGNTYERGEDTHRLADT